MARRRPENTHEFRLLRRCRRVMLAASSSHPDPKRTFGSSPRQYLFPDNGKIAMGIFPWHLTTNGIFWKCDDARIERKCHVQAHSHPHRWLRFVQEGRPAWCPIGEGDEGQGHKHNSHIAVPTLQIGTR